MFSAVVGELRALRTEEMGTSLGHPWNGVCDGI